MNNLVSTIPNFVAENFAGVPVLNPVPVTDVENTTSSVVSAEVSAASNIPASTSLHSNLPANENNAPSSQSNILQKFISPFASKQSSKSATDAVTTARVLSSKQCLERSNIKRRPKKKKRKGRKKKRGKEKEGG